MSAPGTFIEMAAESSSAAAFDGSQDLYMSTGNPAVAVLDELRSYGADDIGHLQRWSVHHALAGDSGTETLVDNFSESNGLTVAINCFFDTCR